MNYDGKKYRKNSDLTDEDIERVKNGIIGNAKTVVSGSTSTSTSSSSSKKEKSTAPTKAPEIADDGSIIIDIIC